MLSGAPRSRDHGDNPRRGVETSRRCLPSKYRSREFWPRKLSRTCFRPADGQPQARSRALPETASTPSSFSGSFDSALETVREASLLPGAPLKMTGAGGFASPQQHRMFGASLVPFAVDRAVLHHRTQGVFSCILCRPCDTKLLYVDVPLQVTLASLCFPA